MFERKQDRDLRNKIAHHDFSLDASGTLKVDGVKINIAQRQMELMKFTTEDINVFMKCLSEYKNGPQ